ncbi:MAG: nucleotide-diphospho-sugar transferase [Mucilaginibacter polytrichastri]|nr:nucleotide-diphospho-sugar transferase [Mucilaginibacter polytrichastri]
MTRLKSPLLFIVFNRPDVTAKVWAQIAAAKPARLYIAADGPRNESDVVLCSETQAIFKNIDWDCDVHTLFRETNLGCKEAVSSAISWFFEREEEGIILEDDCLPADDFFSFCDLMLEKFRNDTRIRHICGCNLQHGQKRGDASYYFSRLTHVWGWASWRRVWVDYDKDLIRFSPESPERLMQKVFEDTRVAGAWADIFRRLKRGEIDTWDFQLAFVNLFNNSLSVIPNSNLISNIGFGAAATHTVNTADKNAALPSESLEEITHPEYVIPDREADSYTLVGDLVLPPKRKSLSKKVRDLFRGN